MATSHSLTSQHRYWGQNSYGATSSNTAYYQQPISFYCQVCCPRQLCAKEFILGIKGRRHRCPACCLCGHVLRYRRNARVESCECAPHFLLCSSSLTVHPRHATRRITPLFREPILPTVLLWPQTSNIVNLRARS